MIQEIETRYLVRGVTPMITHEIMGELECDVFSLIEGSKFGLEWTIHFYDKRNTLVYFEMLETCCRLEFRSCKAEEMDMAMNQDYRDLKRIIATTALGISIQLKEIHELLEVEVKIEELTQRIFRKIITFEY